MKAPSKLTVTRKWISTIDTKWDGLQENEIDCHIDIKYIIKYTIDVKRYDRVNFGLVATTRCERKFNFEHHQQQRRGKRSETQEPNGGKQTDAMEKVTSDDNNYKCIIATMMASSMPIENRVIDLQSSVLAPVHNASHSVQQMLLSSISSYHTNHRAIFNAIAALLRMRACQSIFASLSSCACSFASFLFVRLIGLSRATRLPWLTY